jgi:hypothetical protein
MIDHTHGRAQIVNGEKYYSPNSRRDLHRIPPKIHPYESIFRVSPGRTLYVRHYHEPQWYNVAFGWMSFLPTHPYFTGFPFERLARIPPLQRKNHGCYLPPSFVQSWRRLETRLCLSVTHLREFLKLGMILPFFPAAWGYPLYVRNRYIAGEIIKLSKGWFVVWMAALSWLLRSPRL